MSKAQRKTKRDRYHKKHPERREKTKAIKTQAGRKVRTTKRKGN